MDVVTFYAVPNGTTEEILYNIDKEIFDNNLCKKRFGIDGYLIGFSSTSDEVMIRLITYWHGMWSHTREDVRKGFLQVSLDPSQDQNARQLLQTFGGNGVK